MLNEFDYRDDVKKVGTGKTGELPKKPILFGPAITEAEKFKKKRPDQAPNVCA